MVIRAEVLDQMVLAREAIAALARAVLDGTIAEDGEMHAGLVALQVCEAGEGAAAVFAGERFSWSSRRGISIDLFSGYVDTGRAYLDWGGESGHESS